VLIDRKGKITHVILGDDRQIVIPEIRWRRTGSRRLVGLRCIHTHLKKEGFTRDDINDLMLLRLDAMAVIDVTPDGAPEKIILGHLSTASETGCFLHESATLRETQEYYRGLIKNIETELEKISPAAPLEGERTGLLIHVSNLPQERVEPSLDELEQLARTAGIRVVERVVQRREKPDPRYLMGKGKLREFMIKALSHGINLVIFDAELLPSQIKAISDFTDIEVMDRTQLILSIFQKRAHNRDGKVRVALAQMRYLLPRLGAKETALSRIRGGIGLRGPGETTAKVARRHLEQRIKKFETEIEELQRKREVKRKARIKSEMRTVSIIGYTNAGKSTLLNMLTGSSQFVENLLFATLNPTTRRLRLPGGTRVVISDTVGLIREMPKSVEGVFRATFEELGESRLLIHLVDISSPEFEDHIKTVKIILAETGLGDIPVLMVFNKVDMADTANRRALCRRFDALAVSAKEGTGITELLEKIESEISGAGKAGFSSSA